MSVTDTLGVIRAELAEIAPTVDVRMLDAESHIGDAGIDSMQTLELVARIEEVFDISLPDEELLGIDRIQDLLSLVESRRPAA